MVTGLLQQRQRFLQNFQPNEIPSLQQPHLETVRRVKEELSSIIQAAYPEAYQPGFNDRPKPAMLPYELRDSIELILDNRTVSFLEREEAALRPTYESQGLELSFGSLFPIVMTQFPNAKFQYKVVVDAQCISCMRQGKKPMAGLIYGVEYQRGDPVDFGYFADGKWKDLELVVTDKRLAADSLLTQELTPACKKHGKESVFQLAVVHKITVAPHKNSHGNGKNGKAPSVEPNTPIFETRQKSSFEYLWKLVKFYEGLKEGVPDAFGARIRTPTERDLALTVLKIVKASPLLWPGAIKPQNFNDLYGWMESNGVSFSRGQGAHFKRLIERVAAPEYRGLTINQKRQVSPATYVELFVPFGSGNDTLSSNATSVLCYTDPTYTLMNSTNRQSRIGYQQRREENRETSTVGEWVIADKLAAISPDESTSAYNRLIIDRRLRESLQRETNFLARRPRLAK